MQLHVESWEGDNLSSRRSSFKSKTKISLGGSMSMEELLKYIQRTNPGMTAGKLMEKMAECRYMAGIVLGTGNVKRK